MNRQIVLLLIILFVLGGIVYFVLPSGEERMTSYETPNVAVRIDSAAVHRIEINRKGGKSVTLENVGGKWMITSPSRYAADASAIRQLIGGFSKFRVGSLISSNPDKQNIFQVDSSGTQITLVERTGKSTSIVLGKMGPSFSELYFRLPDSRDVYLGEGIDTWSVNKEVRDWRDRAIVQLPTEAVQSLSYNVNSTAKTFLRDSAGWKENDQPLDAASINSALNSLSALRAEDFADSDVDIQSQPVTMTVDGAEQLTLNMYPILPDSARYYVKSSASPQTYIVGKWTVQELLKPIQHAIPAGKAGAPPLQQLATRSEERKNTERTEPEKKEKIQVASNEPTMKLPTKTSERKATEQKPVIPHRPTGSSLQIADTTASGTSPIAKQSETAPPPTRKTQPVSPPTPAESSPSSSISYQTPSANGGGSSRDDDGELTIHTVKKGETMTTIAQRYRVSVEQILKWNLLKSITVKPGQELYIFVAK